MVKQRIYMIDENASEAEMLSRKIAELSPDIEFIREPDAGKALEQLRAGFDPDLVILDLRLPVNEGIEFLEQVHAESALDAPIIVLTNSAADDADKERSMNAGANDWHPKPHTSNEFTSLANMIVDYLGGAKSRLGASTRH